MGIKLVHLGNGGPAHHGEQLLVLVLKLGERVER